jgi:hypothetical protein
MTELLLTFMLYLGIKGDPPSAQVLPHAELRHPQHCASGCAGMFMPDGRILLSDRVDLTSKGGQSVVLHELRHWQQWKKCGPAYDAKSWEAREFDAYCVQSKWLREQRSGVWVIAPGISPESLEERCESHRLGHLAC